MSVPVAILEAAQAAALPARAVSEAAAITAGVEVALAANRRCWGRRLLERLGELPITATSQREFIAALAEEFSAAADEIDHRDGRGRTVHVVARASSTTWAWHQGAGAPHPTFDGPRGPRCQ